MFTSTSSTSGTISVALKTDSKGTKSSKANPFFVNGVAISADDAMAYLIAERTEVFVRLNISTDGVNWATVSNVPSAFMNEKVLSDDNYSILIQQAMSEAASSGFHVNHPVFSTNVEFFKGTNAIAACHYLLSSRPQGDFLEISRSAGMPRTEYKPEFASAESILNIEEASTSTPNNYAARASYYVQDANDNELFHNIAFSTEWLDVDTATGEASAKAKAAYSVCQAIASNTDVQVVATMCISHNLAAWVTAQ